MKHSLGATSAVCASAMIVVAGWAIAQPPLPNVATQDAVTPVERHGVLHVNCPPGSHGKPRTFGVGADILRAREAARLARDATREAVPAVPGSTR